MASSTALREAAVSNPAKKAQQMFRSMPDPTELTISRNFDVERMVGEPRRDGERCQPDGARQDEEEGELMADGDSHCNLSGETRAWRSTSNNNNQLHNQLRD